jgi:glycosyltransferase involved in cell wall biosynthesis
MKVLQVSAADSVGSRFNGLSMRSFLADEAITVAHLVWEKRLYGDRAIVEAFDFPMSRLLNLIVRGIERQFSLQSMLQLQSFAIPAHRCFREADAVHYHIIHNGFFSLLALPWLSRLKPSVWTWHDPWIMTGHCIYPLDCTRWQTGCGSCPDLNLPFAMRRDRTHFHVAVKRRIIERSRIHVIVASHFMMEMATRSPVGRLAQLHHIPFGLDLDRFRPRDRLAARRRFGVFDDHVVIGVRAFPGPYKGLDHFIKALERLAPSRPVTIIASHSSGALERFSGRFQTVNLDWVSDEDLLIDAYAASDFFVMPSTAEAFGMMAIEAMACARPVIVYDRTSLPEITFAPDFGVSVPQGDVAALAAAIERLIADPGEREHRGAIGRTLAERHYNGPLHAKRLADLYRRVVAERRPPSKSADAHMTIRP